MNAKEEIIICTNWLNQEFYQSEGWFRAASQAKSRFKRIERGTGCVVDYAWSVDDFARAVWLRGNKVAREEIAFRFTLLSNSIAKECILEMRGVSVIYFPLEQLLEVIYFGRSHRMLFLELGINCYDPHPTFETYGLAQ